MAKTINYGMGQYRYNASFEYIGEVYDSTKDTNSIKYFKNDAGGINYQDILFDFPKYTPVNSSSDKGDTSNIIQYGTTYYMELTVPQNRKHQLVLNLRLYGQGNGVGDDININPNQFQNIKRLVIPPTSALDDISSEVILYEDPNGSGLIKADVIDDQHIKENTEDKNSWESNTAYKAGNKYYYKINNNLKEITKYSDNYELTQNWKLNNEIKDPAVVTFKFAFSPKYSLTGGFPYMALEIERNGAENYSIEYIENNVTYYGLKLDKDKIEAKIYTVANLLHGATTLTSEIQSGISSLNHIAVWGHPEQIITINGEEIKIGQTSFYELKDFNINYLGVVVTDSNKDRFIIDYEYRIVPET